MNLTKNFTLKEMLASNTAQRLKIDNTPDETVITNLLALCMKVLQPVRDKYGSPIRVTSGYRCETLNKAVGGVRTSQHLKGQAADIVCADNHSLWSLMTEMVHNGEITVGQLINEKNLTWIHVSLPDSRHKNQILSIR